MKKYADATHVDFYNEVKLTLACATWPNENNQL